MVQRYDHPNALIRRWHSHRAGIAPDGSQTAGTATAGTTGHFTVPGGQSIRLVAAHASVAVTGTSTTNNYELQIGTDSVGIWAISSEAAAVTSQIGSSASPLGTATQFQTISVIKQDGATGQVDFTYEFEVLPDSVLA